MRLEKELGIRLADGVLTRLTRLSVLVPVLVLCAQPGFAQSTRELHRTFPVDLAEPLSLRIELSKGDLQVAYSREGQVSIAAIAQVPIGRDVGADFFTTRLITEKAGNRLEIRDQFHADDAHDIRIAYQLDVPYRTEVHVFLDHGNQTIIGVMGPVAAESSHGDIKVSYVSKEVKARAGQGDLNLQVIGGRVEASTGRGNISCVRAAEGVSSETGDGDISLMVVGSSKAMVRKGNGRIVVGGVKGALSASTDAGDLHIKAVPHDGWQLRSTAGNIRVELPPAAKFEIDASTDSGEVVINRDDIEKPRADVRHLCEKVNGGGKRIEIHTGGGRIVVT
jgi:hypothetical protein